MNNHASSHRVHDFAMAELLQLLNIYPKSKWTQTTSSKYLT